ncbi:MAG: hypothetical protein C4293_21540 [Nitrospiraceae bacterium]
MEGAKAFKVLAGSGKGHITRHNVGDIYPFTDPINDILRDRAKAHTVLFPLSQPSLPSSSEIEKDRSH